MSLAEGLRETPLFTPLSDEEIARLVNVAVVEKHWPGETIVRQGEAGDAFYVVLTGQLCAHVTDTQGRERSMTRIAEGGFFGDLSLLTGEPRAATVRVIRPCELAIFSTASFHRLIANNPRIRAYLMERAKRRGLLMDSPFPGKQWDEIAVVMERRNVYALLEGLLTPLLILLALVVAGGSFYLLLNSLDVALCAGPILLIISMWILYIYVNWRNDIFIVTNKRVIHLERRLLYGESRGEVPLEQIQDAMVKVPDFLLARYLGYYDVIVQPAGAGAITFDRLSNAEQVREHILAERAGAIAQQATADRARIQRELRRQLRLPPEEELPAAKQETPSTPPPRGRLYALFMYFIPRIRIEEGNSVTWRKHRFILLKYTVLPLILFIGALGLLTLLGVKGAGLPSILIASVLVLAALVYVFWQYEKWRNDIYTVTETRILDINKSPFGLGGETSRAAPFDAIQDVTYDIPSVFARIINMGTVTIRTAGVGENLIFHNVFDPSAIQQEIFNRLVAFRERHREEELERSLQQVGLWFGEYAEIGKAGRGEQKQS